MATKYIQRSSILMYTLMSLAQEGFFHFAICIEEKRKEKKKINKPWFNKPLCKLCY